MFYFLNYSHGGQKNHNSQKIFLMNMLFSNEALK